MIVDSFQLGVFGLQNHVICKVAFFVLAPCARLLNEVHSIGFRVMRLGLKFSGRKNV